MKTILATILLSSLCVAQPCKISFTVISEDSLGNLDSGLSPKEAEWFRHKVESKHPDVCYAAPSENAELVFFIRITPDTYHGTQVVNNTRTNTAPVSGTVTDPDGNTANVTGTEQVTSTTSTAVPYSVDYGVYTLSLEQRRQDGSFAVLRTFQQKGLYDVVTFYGIPLGGGGKGKHPDHTVIEEAVKWIDEGGIKPANGGWTLVGIEPH